MSKPDTKLDLLIPKRTELPPHVLALPLGDLLLPYQSKAVTLAGKYQLLVIEKSRRIGLTWGIAAHAALTASIARGDGGQDVFYMGYDQEMAREFIDVVGMWAKAFSIAASDVDEVVLKDDEKDIKTFRIQFASGYEVVALPSVPRALRGKQGLVIVDEAAFHSDLAQVLKAALALLMWGGSVIVISTHDGVDNPFNLLIDDIRAGRRKGGTLKITFDDALAEGLFERIAMVTKQAATAVARAEWISEIRGFYGDDAGEELDCIPASGAGSWLSMNDIIAAQHPDAALPELYQGGLVHVGWDIARRRDLSVVWPFETLGDVMWLRERVEMEKTRFQVQYAEIDRIMTQYRVVRLAMDQTGMGESVVEHIQDRHGAHRCEGVVLSGPRRLDLATALKERFENGTIRIPNDPAIRADLRAIKKHAGPTGAPRLVNATDEVHADMFWAAALAAAAAATPYQAFAYHTPEPPAQRGGRRSFDRPDHSGDHRTGGSLGHGFHTRGGF